MDLDVIAHHIITLNKKANKKGVTSPKSQPPALQAPAKAAPTISQSAAVLTPCPPASKDARPNSARPTTIRAAPASSNGVSSSSTIARPQLNTPKPVVTQSSTGRFKVAVSLQARECHTEIQPRTLYQHAEVRRFTGFPDDASPTRSDEAPKEVHKKPLRPASAPAFLKPAAADPKSSSQRLDNDDGWIREDNDPLTGREGEPDEEAERKMALTFMERVQHSEERMIKSRSVRPFSSGHERKNNPPSLQLYVARLRDGKGHRNAMAAEQAGTAVGASLASTDGELPSPNRQGHRESTEGILNEAARVLTSIEVALLQHRVDMPLTSAANAAQQRASISGGGGMHTAVQRSLRNGLHYVFPTSSIAKGARSQYTASTAEDDRVTLEGGETASITSPTAPRSASEVNFKRNNSQIHSFAMPSTANRMSKVEQEVAALVKADFDKLRAQILRTKNEVQRAALQEELARLELVGMQCRSASSGIDFAERKAREIFRARVALTALDDVSKEARILYGDKAQKLLIQQQRERRKRLLESVLARGQNIRDVTKEERIEEAKTRRVSLLNDERAQGVQIVEEWEKKADRSHTMSFADRANVFETQQRERLVSSWTGVLLVRLYPQLLIRQKAVRLERMFLGRKKKEELVKVFADKMRDVLHRRRRRVARLILHTVKLSTYVLFDYFWHQRRRKAITEVIDWFQEYLRRRPSLDVIRRFKQAIVKCQRLAREYIARRCQELCWALAAMYRKAPGGTAAQKQLSLARRQSEMMMRRRSSVSGSSGGPTSTERVVDKILDTAVAPFDIRLDVARAFVRRKNTAYVSELLVHLKRKRGERMRDKLGKYTKNKSRAPNRLISCNDQTILEMDIEVKRRFRIFLRHLHDSFWEQATEENLGPTQTSPVAVENFLRQQLPDKRELHFVTKYGDWILEAPVPPVANEKRTAKSGGGGTRAAPMNGPTSSSGQLRTWRDALGYYQRDLRKL